MSEVKPCTDEERGLLGVDEKYVNSGPLSDIREAVRITREDLLRHLKHLADDPERQHQARVELLASRGFDATKPYRVIEYFDCEVYSFRYEREQQ